MKRTRARLTRTAGEQQDEEAEERLVEQSPDEASDSEPTSTDSDDSPGQPHDKS